MKKYLVALAVALGLLGFTACSSSDSDTVSENISKEADNFTVYRQVVLYNGITDKVIVAEEGYCSQGNDSTKEKISIICKVGKGKHDYTKNIYNMSDNTIVFNNQLKPTSTNPHFHKVVFHPTLPDIDIN